MGELYAPLGKELDDPVDDARLDRVETRLRVNGWRRAKRRSIWPAASIGAVAAAAAAVLLVFYSFVGPDQGRDGNAVGTLSFASGEPLGEGQMLAAPPSTRERIELSDGSTLVLAAGAELRATKNDRSHLSFLLDHGRVTFDIPPGGNRQWAVDAGEALITVLGTSFTVERSSTEVWVSVDRGVVAVTTDRDASPSVRLARGESLTIPLGELAQPSTPSQDSPTLPPGAAEGSDGGPAPAGGRPRWRRLAEQRQYQTAYALLGSEGIRREVSLQRSVADLFALADVARLSGHPREAMAPLRRIVNEHRSDRRASLAAFTLGRLQMDVFGNPARAQQCFEQTLALGAPPQLREDALARLVEAQAQAGDRVGAQSTARRYLRLYPSGRMAGSVRRWARIENE